MTPKQEEVLEGKPPGKNDGETAKPTDTGEASVRNYTQRICKLLGLNNLLGRQHSKHPTPVEQGPHDKHEDELDEPLRTDPQSKKTISDSEHIDEEDSMPDRNLDQILDTVVSESRDVETILVINLNTGTVDYYNKKLEQNETLFKTLYGEGGVSEAICNFKDIESISETLQGLSKTKDFGDFRFTIFYLEKRTLIMYFTKVENADYAICYISVENPGIGRLILSFNKSISELEKAFVCELS